MNEATTGILIKDGVAWLPIPLDSLGRLQTETREALGWKLEDFINRAAQEYWARICREEWTGDPADPRLAEIIAEGPG